MTTSGYILAIGVFSCLAFFYNIVIPGCRVHLNSLFWSGNLLISYIAFWFQLQYAGNCYYFNEFIFYYTISSTNPLFYTPMYSFGWDIYTVLFIGLINIIFVLCFYYSIYTVELKIRCYYGILWTIYILLILTFSALDLFTFYILFEMLLLPMFFLIGIWGARKRRFKAALYFYMYTSVSSFFFLYALVAITAWFNVSDYIMLKHYFFADIGTKDAISWSEASIVWWCLFITFAAKLPMMPFHIWLPEAHVEAPTAGSVILASLMLKLGAYGLIRFVFPFFPTLTLKYGAVVAALLLMSTIYATLIAMVQPDLKRIIAYSSIAHMNFAVLGLFSFNLTGFSGGVLLFIGHTFVSAGLFFLTGSMTERFGSRLFKYYSGVGMYAPQLASCFLFFSFANIGFPGTVNFVAEFLIFQGLITASKYGVVFLLGISFVCSLFYSIWVYNRIFHGTPNEHYLPQPVSRDEQIQGISDLFYYEKIIYSVLAVFIVLFGLLPSYLLTLNWYPY